MGESTCLLHSFSYADPNNQGNPNPINALGESVSFGRFTSESLSWEKWSSFSQKRHVEEAERYAQSGSVAQKKAFFEAHYKRIAAKKAAALLEQANAEKTPETEVEDPICDENSSTHGAQTAALSFHDPQAAVLKPQPLVAVSKEQDKDDTIVNAEGYNSAATVVILELDKVIRADAFTENVLLPESQLNNEPFTHLQNVEDQNVVSGLEDPGTPQMEKPLLKNLKSNEDTPTSARKRNPVLSSIRSSVFRKASKVPPSPAKSMASVHPRKENVHTPRTKIPTMDLTDKRRSTPKSLKRLANSTPVKEPNRPNRTTIPPLQKIESAKVALSARKAPKDCATPLKTPKKTFMNGVKKHPVTTPSSETIRKVETPVHPTASGSKTTGPKWHIISAVSKSFTACRNKLQSPTLSTPFILRTEERAARRKQKLEEKFNAKDVQKVQLQTKLKEKAETEFRKLRQSLCFKARPLPDFYRERETSINQIRKTPRADPTSLTAGKRPSRTTRGKISQPPLVSSIKSNSSKNVWTKDGLNPTRSPTLAEMITHENTSPNIQL